MKTTDPLVSAVYSTQRSWRADGLAGVFSGIQLLILSLMFSSFLVVPETSPWHPLVKVSFLAALVVMFAFSRRLLETIKNRTTFSRTGFVSMRPMDHNAYLVGAVAAVGMTVLLLAIKLHTSTWMSWAYFLVGLMLGLLWILQARAFGLSRYFAVAAVSIGLGLTLAIWHPGLEIGMAVFFGLLGVTQVVMGCVAFLRFLRQRPASMEGQA